MEDHKNIKMQCLFCFSDQFIVDEDKDYTSGDQIKCASCGAMNDYDSLMRVVKRKGEEWAQEQANKLTKKFEKDMKKLFK